jgi:hypothetical protein
MTQISYAIVTPSFRTDADRCALLIESVERFVAPHVKHYVVIDRRDLPLFRPLVSSRTELLIVEDIVPGWLIRVPGIRRFWLSLRTRPVKNWILQQLVKISIPFALRTDVLLYSDSDVFFIKPFDPRTLERGGNVPLYRETGQRGVIDFNDRWQAVGSRLLGLPVETGCDTNYVGNVITWRRENVVSMCEYIEQNMRVKWQRAIVPLNVFSEYILYGLFADRLLGTRSGHWHDPVTRTLCHWQPTLLDIAGLEKLKQGERPEHYSVMISAKSKTPVADIRRVFVGQ